MNKIRKMFNEYTLDYATVVLGLILAFVSLYKKDTITSILGFLLMSTSLNNISWGKNNKKIKDIQKSIEELKGDSDDTEH